MSRRTVSLVAVVLGGCTPRCGAPPSPAPAVEISGCHAVLQGPLCELRPSREVRIVAAAPAGARLRVEAGGEAIDESEGGLRAVRVPPGAAELEVALVADGRRSAPFRLAVRDPVRSEELARAADLAARGDPAAAASALQPHLDQLPAEDRPRAGSIAARAQLQAGRTAEAIAALETSAAQHQALGHVSEATRDTLAAAYALVNEWRFDEAKEALAAAAARSRGYDEGAALVSYYSGLLFLESGDLRSALRLLGDAADEARRLGMTRERDAALQVLSSALVQLGRPGEALERLRALRPEHPCDQATLANNVAWAMLSSDLPLGDPLPPLQQALALFQAGCRQPAEEANVLLNLALAELRRGAPDAAAARLEEARRARAQPEPRLAMWWLDVEARIALGRGRTAEALALYRRLSSLAEASGSGEGRWRAAVGRAEVLAARGDARGALRAHEEADRVLDAEALLVPLTEGRERFLAERERGVRHQVMLLVQQGRPAEAMVAARRARARFLQAVGLGQRLSALGPKERAAWNAALASYRRGRAAYEADAAQDWALAEDQLLEAAERRKARAVALRRALDDALAALGASAAPSPAATRAPGPGELLLMWFPGADRWYGFAATAHGTVARALPGAPELKDGGASLLQPFDALVEAAAQVTFIPYGALRGADLHAAPWRGAPLAAARPVAYAVDLPAPKAAAGAAPEAKRDGSLVVGDPLRNLPQARREAEAVHAALRGRGQPSTLRLGEQATLATLRQELGAVRHLHYAGHGRFGGEGGWGSALPLADGELTAGDILTLPAPGTVVLAGCETGKAAEGPLESIGLAQAFILAGARAVVAASRPVDDRMAARLSAALYERGGRPEPPAMPELLRQAQAALREQGQDWSAFRVLVQ